MTPEAAANTSGQTRGTAAKAATAAPVVIDFGDASTKQLKRLRKGKGKAMSQVLDTIAELQGDGTIAGNAQPVIVIVGRKPDWDMITDMF